MDLRVVSSPSAVAGECGSIRRVQQRPGAAGEIADPQCGHRVPVRPVDIETRYGELREQRRRARQGVEGREELSVRDQALKHPPAKIVLAGRAEGIELSGDLD